MEEKNKQPNTFIIKYRNKVAWKTQNDFHSK